MVVRRTGPAQPSLSSFAVLADEQKEAWRLYQRNCPPAQRKLKNIIQTCVDEDEDFQMSMVNVWLNEERNEGRWDWSKSTSSVAYKKAHRKKRVFKREKLRPKTPPEDLEAKRQKEAEQKALYSVKDERQCMWKYSTKGIEFIALIESLGIQ